MFRIACDTSSGSTELCLTEITRDGSQVFFLCLVGVCQRNFEPAVCVHDRAHTPQVQNYADKHRPSTLKISVSHHE